MKKIFLMGRSEAGKTSLTQALKGEELHYVKTQYTTTDEDTIDSPGEYAESKRFSVGLACFSFEADVVAIVQAADEPFNLFGASCRCFILRPLIGIITKIDSPYANVEMVKQWMINAGCERIFLVNNVTREGIDELMEYLQEDMSKLTMEQARFKQSLGLNDWDPLPDGVEYPKDTRCAEEI
ncbi:EutP/PduV family microcompartment system protein [Blautia sp. HCP3S3_G3]|uniref:EutP/PduV family microcompartment system protein n=1 Tax=Blautia sp. HCP3S3_G3 TaxID=3438913 RepID=UPI003F8C7492